MSSKETKTTKDYLESGNFKALYNKQYGDIAKISKQASMTPQQVFEQAVAYFTWAESNSIKAAETASFQGEVTESKIHKVRVFTVTGMCLYLGISNKTFERWRSMDGYRDVAEWIDSVIYEQKFQLAVNGIVNSSFIAKDIGLDKPTTINVEANNQSVNGEQLQDAVKSVLDLLGG